MLSETFGLVNDLGRRGGEAWEDFGEAFVRDTCVINY